MASEASSGELIDPYRTVQLIRWCHVQQMLFGRDFILQVLLWKSFILTGNIMGVEILKRGISIDSIGSKVYLSEDGVRTGN